MEISEPRQLTINYPIVPARIFKHHTNDLEAALTMLVCRIHESGNLSDSQLLSNSAYLTMLSAQLTLMLSNYQGDLIHQYMPTGEDE